MYAAGVAEETAKIDNTGYRSAVSQDISGTICAFAEFFQEQLDDGQEDV